MNHGNPIQIQTSHLRDGFSIPIIDRNFTHQFNSIIMNQDVSILEGKTLSSVIAKNDQITFTTVDGEVYLMYHSQDCCEYVTIKEFATLEECKYWFEMVCNIPWNWNVITPSGRTLDGKYYQTW